MDDIAESREDVALASLDSEAELADTAGCCVLAEFVTSSVMSREDGADWLPCT
jgi:hypothetical protein